MAVVEVVIFCPIDAGLGKIGLCELLPKSPKESVDEVDLERDPSTLAPLREDEDRFIFFLGGAEWGEAF